MGSPENAFTPESANRGQPSMFAPGTHMRAFLVILQPADFPFVWQLDGNAVTITVETARTYQCPDPITSISHQGAIGQIRAFEAAVEAQRGKKLHAALAAWLVDEAEALLAMVEVFTDPALRLDRLVDRTANLAKELISLDWDDPDNNPQIQAMIAARDDSKTAQARLQAGDVAGAIDALQAYREDLYPHREAPFISYMIGEAEAIIRQLQAPQET